MVHDVFRSATDFADPIPSTHTIAAIGRIVRVHLTPEIHCAKILKLLKSGQAANSSFSAAFFWQVVSPAVRAPHQEHENLFVADRVSPGHAVL